MKTQLLSLFVLAGGILVGGGLRAQAQIAEDVKVNVPFSFHAAGKEYPAGNYTIRTVGVEDDSLMEIQSADGHTAGVFETEHSDINGMPKNNELIFNQMGDEYFLFKIVDADNGMGAEIFDPNYTGKSQAAAGATSQKHIPALSRIP